MRAAALIGLSLLLAADLAFAEKAAGAGPAPATTPSPAPGPSRLNLGPYRSVHADDPASLADQFRFQERVEVHGKAMDSAALTAKLEWWMRDFDLTRGATPASLSAPSIAEMHDYRPHPPDSINLIPVMQWLTEKLSGKKKP